MLGVRIGFDNPNIRTIWPSCEVRNRTKRTVAFPLGQSRFEHYFAPVFPLMRNLFWFAHRSESSPFVDLIYEPGGEERLERYQIDHPRFDNTSATILQPGCLPELAGWIRDDSIDLLGFAPGGTGPGEIADELFQAAGLSVLAYFTAIEQRVSLRFFCADGFSWEFYSPDGHAVMQIFEHAKSLEGVNLGRAVLEDRGRRNA
jgi:hypothetical protein